MNQCIFIGRLTRDVEIKNTASGKAVGSFCIAVDRPFKDANGQKITDFIPCKAWEQKAGFIAHHFKKGDMIAVTGEFQSRSYEDDLGNKKTMYEIVVQTVEFCGNNNKANAPKAPSTPLEVPVEVSEPLADEDLPFDI